MSTIISISKINEFHSKYSNEWKLLIKNSIEREKIFIFFYPEKLEWYSKLSEYEQYKIVQERCNKYARLEVFIQPEVMYRELGINNNQLLKRYFEVYNYYFSNSNDLETSEVITLNTYKSEFNNKKSMTEEQ